jgi:hypothetical protein
MDDINRQEKNWQQILSGGQIKSSNDQSYNSKIFLRYQTQTASKEMTNPTT